MRRLRMHLEVWIIPLVLSMLLSPLFLRNLDDLHNFAGDETLWLAVSNKLFQLYFIENDFFASTWHDEFSTFGSRQPQIGKYLIGLGTTMAGYSGEPYNPYYYNWQHDLAWNMSNGGVPPADIVASGRLPIAITGLLSCLIFYWLVTLVTNRWTAVIATLSLVQAGLLTASSRRAMIDTPALAFGLLTLVGLVYLLRALRHHQRRQAIVVAILTGLACGLAVGTKLNTLLILGLCGGVLLFRTFLNLRKEFRQAVLSFLCLTVVYSGTAFIAYISNPFLYRSTLAGMVHLLEMGQLVATIPFGQLTTPVARMQAIWQSMNEYAPLARLGLAYDRWLLLLGIIALGRSAWQNINDFRARQLDVIVLWIIVSYVGIGLWLPHPWERYYLPLQPCNAILQAYGVVWALQGMYTWSTLRLRSHYSIERKPAS